MSEKSAHFETTCVHAGRHVDPATGAVAPPIHLSTTFERKPDYAPEGYVYGRSANPNRDQLEACLAALEGGTTAIAFASGAAAASAVFQSLKPGDHVICTRDAYHGVLRILREIMSTWELKVSYVDASDLAALQAAVTRDTRLIWVESPSNPLLKLTDIAAVADIARRADAYAVCDSTFATPALQNPLALGMDLVMHSTTKYIGGHSDVIGGALVTNDAEIHEACRFYQNAAGGVPSPFDSFLVQRGLKTLAVRMERHQANAFEVASVLQGHARVGRLFFPGFADHPGHAAAKRQMTGFPGMISFELKGGRPAVERFVQRLKVFTFAESLGGVESLACHPTTMTHGAIPQADRERIGITEGLMRLSVGIEDAEDLKEDISQALE